MFNVDFKIRFVFSFKWFPIFIIAVEKSKICWEQVKWHQLEGIDWALSRVFSFFSCMNKSISLPPPLLRSWSLLTYYVLLTSPNFQVHAGGFQSELHKTTSTSKKKKKKVRLEAPFSLRGADSLQTALPHGRAAPAEPPPPPPCALTVTRWPNLSNKAVASLSLVLRRGHLEWEPVFVLLVLVARERSSLSIRI